MAKTTNQTIQPVKPIRLSVLDTESLVDVDHDAQAGVVCKRDCVEQGDPFSRHKILNHYDRLIAVARGELAYPVTVEIDPSNVCNHRCPWCVSSEAHSGDMLSLECLDKMAEHLASLDVRSIVLKGGGEPTVHPKFNEIMAAITQRNISIGIVTNGSMPRKGTPDAILEHARWIRISLDAANKQTHARIHGTADFEKIVANVKYLASNSQTTLVGLNFVAEEANCREIYDFAQLGKDMGVGYVSIRCVFDPHNPLPRRTRQTMRAQAARAKTLENEHFRVFLGNFTDDYLNADIASQPQQKCLGPNLVGVVGADGEVYACCFLRGYKDFSFGNVKDSSFEQIWKSDKRQQVMGKVYRGQCGHVCIGGMTANRYNLYNEILNYLASENKAHSEFV